VDLLFDAIIAASDRFALLGVLKSLKTKLDEKRKPIAGTEERGDTDHMADLCGIVDQDEERFQAITKAGTEVKAYTKDLNTRLEEAKIRLGLRTK
jgi:hypothetical protein